MKCPVSFRFVSRRRVVRVLLLAAFPLWLQLSCGDSVPSQEDAQRSLVVPTPDLKVAFIGDSGYGPRTDRVLELIRREGAHLVLHQGDLGYDEGNLKTPVNWHSGVERILDAAVEGGRFPYLYSVGNHDVRHWRQKNPPGYGRILQERVDGTPGLECTGDLGVKSSCTYQGLFLVLSGVGSMGQGHRQYLSESLQEGEDFLWRIASWHKNQQDMQAGGKRDDTGWGVYRDCQAAGAIIATGHEHSYSRSYTLTDLGNEAAGHGATGSPERMVLGKDKTFVLVSGLGGKSGRDYHCEQHEDDTWWASVFARNYWLANGVVKEKNCTTMDPDGKQYARTVREYADGALFITFNPGGQTRLARGEFLTVEGERIDEFEIVNERSPDAAVSSDDGDEKEG